MLYDFVPNQDLTWGSPGFSLAAIARDLYKEVYGKPYPGDTSERTIHGMGHISRATILGAAGYNLMQLAGVEGVDSLETQTKSEEIVLVQLALMLHDSGAISDGKDMNDPDSGLNLYHYFTKRLGIPAKQAQIVTNAMLNKDWKPGMIYHELVVDDKAEASIKEHEKTEVFPFSQETNRFRMAINYGDCLDYIRTGHPFSTDYLLLLNQDYPEDKKTLLRRMTFRIFQDALRLNNNFYEQEKVDPKVNQLEAFDWAVREIKSQNMFLAQVYHEGESALPDPNWAAPGVVEEEADPTGFLMKNIGSVTGGSITAWADFVTHLIDGDPYEFRHPSRSSNGFTSRQRYNSVTRIYDTEVVPIDQKSALRSPLWTKEDKKGTTRDQSMSYASESYRPTAFAEGFPGEQVGIKISLSGAKIKRIMNCDGATYRRQYDQQSPIGAYWDSKNRYLKSLNELAKVNRTYDNNEIMARIKWDESDDQCTIMIFSDNQESRIFAQARALDLGEAVRVRREKLGLPALPNYIPKIIFYRSLKEYTLAEQQADLASKKLFDISTPMSYGLRAARGDKTVTIDQIIEFMKKIGIRYSRHFHLLILKTVEADPRVIEVLPPSVVSYILKDEKSRHYQAMIDNFMNNKQQIGLLLAMKPKGEWSEFLNTSAVKAKIQGFLAESADLFEFFIEKYRYIDIVLELIDKLSYLDPKQQDKSGLSALDHLCIQDEGSALAHVFKIRGLGMKDVGKVKNRLMMAIQLGDLVFAKSCIDHNEGMNDEHEGNYPIHLACTLGHLDQVEHLVKIPGQINLVNKYGKTPLCLAVEQGNIPLIQLLFREKADSSFTDKYKDSLLHLAKTKEVIEELLEQGLDINAVNKAGESTLSCAFDRDDMDSAIMLLKRGASSNSEDIRGRTPLHRAVTKQKLNEELLELLLKQGAPLNKKNKEGSTALLLAIRTENTPCANWLLDHGADLTLADENGITPLHSACGGGLTEMIKRLINQGASIHAKDNKNRNPLVAALDRRKYSTAIDLIQLKPEILDSIPSDYAFGLSDFPDELLPKFIPLLSKGTVQKSIKSSHDLVKILMKLDPAAQTRVINLLGLETIATFINDFYSFTDLFVYISAPLQEKFVGLFKDKNLSLPEESSYRFKDSLNKIQPKFWLRLMNTLDMSALFSLFSRTFAPEDTLLSIGQQLPEADKFPYISLLMTGESFKERFTHVLNETLDLVPVANRQEFLEKLDADLLRKQLKYSFQIGPIMDKLPDPAKQQFLRILGSEHLRKIYDSYFSVDRFLESLSDSGQVLLLDLLGADYLKEIIKDNFDIRLCLKGKTDFVKAKIIGMLGIEHLTKLSIYDFAATLQIETCLELGLILRELPASDWGAFFQKLRPNAVQPLLENGKYLYVLMSKLKLEDRGALMPALKECLDPTLVDNYFEDDESKRGEIKVLIDDLLKPESTESLRAKQTINKQ